MSYKERMRELRKKRHIEYLESIGAIKRKSERYRDKDEEEPKRRVEIRVKTPSGRTEKWNLNMSESTLKWYLEKKKKEGYEIIQVLSGAKPKRYKVKTSKENLEKVKRTYLENIKKSVYDPKNIQKLKAFGWSDEKIKQWQREQLKKAEERVKNKAELEKLAKYWIEKGKIPGEVTIEDIEITAKSETQKRMIQRANQNLKKPISEPKHIPKPEPKSVTPKPAPKPIGEPKSTTTATPIKSKIDFKLLGVILLGVLAFSLLLRR